MSQSPMRQGMDSDILTTEETELRSGLVAIPYEAGHGFGPYGTRKGTWWGP